MSAPQRRRAAINVFVTEHARGRARERFPGYKAARIIDEVHEALVEGRFSKERPAGMTGRGTPDCCFAWTADGERVFVLGTAQDCFTVATVLRRDGEGA